MLTFAALVPHSPLLLPSLGQGQEKKLKETRAALAKIKTRLLVQRPETLIILSPHSFIFPDAFAFNLSPEYFTDFKEFGDLGKPARFPGDLSLIDRFQRNLRHRGQAITLFSEPKLEYGAGVPLALLTKKENPPRLIPLSRSGLDFKSHFSFGAALAEEIASSSKKIALLASANQSHRLSSLSPAGFSPRGEEFDALLQEALAAGNLARLISLDPELVKEAQPCGFRNLLILLGVLSEINFQSRLLSYEHPFGIGYLTVEFEI